MLQNRTNPRVHGAFVRCLGEEDLLTDYDHVCFRRPTEGHKKWETKTRLHLHGDG